MDKNDTKTVSNKIPAQSEANANAPLKTSATVESREGGKITDSKNTFPELAIIAKDIHKYYFEAEKQLEVLKGINLEIERGEIVALVGPSGAGKSTLLHILGLMEKPSSGELTVLGWQTQNLKENDQDNLRNKYIGFLFQFHYLLPELTVLENTALPLRIAGIEKMEAEGRAADLLVSLGLKDRMTHLPQEISGGEQQRTALARALANQPALLLCDEPTGNLDLERGEEIRDLIWRTARAHHATVLIATHNPDIANKADKIVRIADGKIVL